MRNTTTVALLTGPLVLLGYVTGAWSVRRVRPDPSRGDGDGDRQAFGAAVGSAIAAVVATTVAWHVIRRVAPSNAAYASSAIAVFSAQAITVWQSVALWVGLAVVVGQVAPPLRTSGRGTGLPATIGLLAVYAPMVLIVAGGAYLTGLAVSRSTRIGVATALGVGLSFEWLAWVNDWSSAWGAANGPELTLWTAVLCLVLGSVVGQPDRWDRLHRDQ